MSAVLTGAGEELDRIASMFPNLSSLAAELKRIGSIDQAAGEAEARAARANNQIDECHDAIVKGEEALADIQATVREQEQKSKLQLENARIEAQRERDAAARDAESIRGIARKQADDILAQANGEADTHLRETKAAMADLDRQIASKQAHLVAVEDAIAAGQDEINRVNEAVNAVRARLGL